ncbi:MAG: hypothetical protein ACLP52_28545 [Streptosporangiaceae bacterium]
MTAEPGRLAEGQTAFVLGGGSNLGAHEVGMLRALLQAKITPDLVVGTSPRGHGERTRAAGRPGPVAGGAAGRLRGRVPGGRPGRGGRGSPHLAAGRAVARRPGADVVVVAHAGLGQLYWAAAIWRALPLDQPLRAAWWRVPAAAAPRAGQACEQWLFEAGATAAAARP